MAPPSADLAERNGTAETFSAHQFSLALSDEASSGTGSSQTALRLVNYTAPNRLLVVQGKSSALISPKSVARALAQYTDITGGATPWVRSGSEFIRTESLADFESRQGTKSIPGTVTEVAIVRSLYLVKFQFTITTKNTTAASGQSVSGITEHGILRVLKINGAKAPPIN